MIARTISATTTIVMKSTFHCSRRKVSACLFVSERYAALSENTPEVRSTERKTPPSDPAGLYGRGDLMQGADDLAADHDL